MLVVCALALVVAAGAFLVIGLAGGDVGDLYLSMGLCMASLVVVAVSTRLTRGRPPRGASEPPTPVPPHGEEEAVAVPAAMAAAAAGVGTLDLEDDPSASLGERLARVDLVEEARSDAEAKGDGPVIWAKPDRTVAAAPPEPEPEAAPAVVSVVDKPTPAPSAPVAAGPVAPAPPVDGPGADFPIADYDALEAAQILPLVSRLWAEEVPLVADRERSTKARPAVLDALAEAAHDPELAFPIAEYASLDADQVIRLLDRLDAGDLRTVQTAERSGPARVGVLVAVADALDALSTRH